MNWWLVALFWLGVGTVVGIIVGSWLAVREDDLDDERERSNRTYYREGFGYGANQEAILWMSGPYDHETGLDFDRNERIRRENR